jgi:hypothetical protein
MAIESVCSPPTRAGRDLVMQDLETLAFNVADGEPWYDGLKVISRGWLQESFAAAGGATVPQQEDEAPNSSGPPRMFTEAAVPTP